MADTKDNARNELTYATTSEPAGESAKRLPANYTRVGMVVSDNLSGSRNMIPADDKDSGEGSTDVVGRIAQSIQIQGNRPKDGNAGQLVVKNAWLNGTLLYWLKSDNTVGDYAWHGSGYVENYEEGSDDEAIRTFTASIKIQGLPTSFQIQT